MVEEETVVEREARVVERERFALVRCGRNDDLGDALIFELGACPPHARQFSVPKPRKVPGAAEGERTFYLLIETV